MGKADLDNRRGLGGTYSGEYAGLEQSARDVGPCGYREWIKRVYGVQHVYGRDHLLEPKACAIRNDIRWAGSMDE